MWITVATPPFTSLEQADGVLAQLDGPPDGLQARYVGTADDGRLRIVALWASKDDADRFRTERLGPAIDATAREMGMDNSEGPKITAYEAHHVMVPAAAHAHA